ncbi:MAG: hypothetical protein JSV61_12340 [Anaerolineales bacterium]|nr:MAG: hypothetical protein JSV61_12340 [Anaerolineales bacterium]
MNHRERIEACLEGNPADRVPVALWRHFPVDDQDPTRLAQATLNFQNTFDFDLVKVTPASSFCLRDWGVQDVWKGATEGTREYVNRVIKEPDDWARLPVLNPTRGYLADQLESLKIITSELGDSVPVIQTIFNPLTQAKNLSGQQKLISHMRKYPQAVHAGLKIIAESTRRFIEALQQSDIAGVFYAVQHAQHGMLTPQEYREFGRAYDLELLEATKRYWLNMLHLHGEDIMFETLADYPVQIMNWHDLDTEPSLNEGLKQFQGAVCGGLRREQTMVLGTPEQVKAEANQAIQITSGKRFILGTGCVVPITAPFGNLKAARESVE